MDEITLKVAIALQSKLTHGEQVRRWYGTTNFDAWGYAVKGISLFEQGMRQSNLSARLLFEQTLKFQKWDSKSKIQVLYGKSI